MYDCIAMHPGVRRAMRKEPTNFIHYPGSALRSRMNFPLAFGQFIKQKFITGEASVEYFTHPDAPANTRDIVPDAKLVFMFRDPVARAWSDHQMFIRDGSAKEDFSVIVRRAIKWLSDPEFAPLVASSLRTEAGPLRYLANGMYALHSKRWLECFDRKNCLFILSEDFFNDPKKQIQAVYRHLGLPEWELPAVPLARFGNYKDKMDSNIETELKAFFAPHNNELEEFLGRKLPW